MTWKDLAAMGLGAVVGLLLGYLESAWLYRRPGR